MRQYNAATVIRQSSRDMLQEFFKHEKCLECINFQKDRLYEIRNAFMALPDKLLRRLEVVMRNVFNFANSENTMLRLIDEVKQYDFEHSQNALEQLLPLTSRYDQAFFVYLHLPELWERTSRFVPADSLTSRYWTRCSGLPKVKPETDQSAIERFGAQISNYYWQKEIRGKKFLVEYQRRTEHLHYYFVYLSDYANSYDFWRDDSCELESKSVSRPINMVFAFDECCGTLDSYNLGGSEVTEALQRIFCDALLHHNLEQKSIYKSSFMLNPLQRRENMLKPMPELGIRRVRITSLEFTYFGVDRRRSHRISTGKNSPDDEIYSIMEHDLNPENIQTTFTKVRYVRLLLEIEINKVLRELCLELTPNACTLKSTCDDLRIIGEKYIKESGIDVQPSLF